MDCFPFNDQIDRRLFCRTVLSPLYFPSIYHGLSTSFMRLWTALSIPLIRTCNRTLCGSYFPTLSGIFCRAKGLAYRVHIYPNLCSMCVWLYIVFLLPSRPWLHFFPLSLLVWALTNWVRSSLMCLGLENNMGNIVSQNYWTCAHFNFARARLM